MGPRASATGSRWEMASAGGRSRSTPLRLVSAEPSSARPPRRAGPGSCSLAFRAASGNMTML